MIKQKSASVKKDASRESNFWKSNGPRFLIRTIEMSYRGKWSRGSKKQATRLNLMSLSAYSWTKLGDSKWNTMPCRQSRVGREPKNRASLAMLKREEVVSASSISSAVR